MLRIFLGDHYERFNHLTFGLILIFGGFGCLWLFFTWLFPILKQSFRALLG